MGSFATPLEYAIYLFFTWVLAISVRFRFRFLELVAKRLKIKKLNKQQYNKTRQLASCLIYAWALPAHPYNM